MGSIATASPFTIVSIDKYISRKVNGPVNILARFPVARLVFLPSGRVGDRESLQKRSVGIPGNRRRQPISLRAATQIELLATMKGTKVGETHALVGAWRVTVSIPGAGVDLVNLASFNADGGVIVALPSPNPAAP